LPGRKSTQGEKRELTLNGAIYLLSEKNIRWAAHEKRRLVTPRFFPERGASGGTNPASRGQARLRGGNEGKNEEISTSWGGIQRI